MFANFVFKIDFNVDDGIMLPSHAEIFTAPCSLVDLKKSTIDYWNNVYGYDMSPLALQALQRTKPEIMVIKQSDLLSEGTPLELLDLKYLEIEELKKIVSKKFVSVSNPKPGPFQGMFN